MQNHHSPHPKSLLNPYSAIAHCPLMSQIYVTVIIIPSAQLWIWMSVTSFASGGMSSIPRPAWDQCQARLHQLKRESGTMVQQEEKNPWTYLKESRERLHRDLNQELLKCQSRHTYQTGRWARMLGKPRFPGQPSSSLTCLMVPGTGTIYRTMHRHWRS